MKIYILWENDEKRPLINRENFGNILAFTSLTNAQAYLKDCKRYREDDETKILTTELQTP